jgi:flagellar biosynthesis/type III secretory pathway M-ring protein FliF/YscJ
MASLQEAIKTATRSLGDMTLSQRLAIGLGALLVVGSLIWMAQWAAKPEMVPLLPGQSLEPEELAVVRAGLDAMGEYHRIDGSQVMVRANANRQAIIASLQQTEQLPADTAIGFAELVKEANPWISQEENSRRWTIALQSELGRLLQQFNGVRQARVILNLNAKSRGFARSNPESTAGVSLFMKGGEPVSRSLALAAARMVAGAVRGLPVENVQVIDGTNNRVALDWENEESGSASSLHHLRRQLEREKELQIKEQLSFDPRVLVSVSVEQDYTTMQVQDSTVSEGATLKEESESTSTIRNKRSGQPGVEPNVGVEVASGSAGDSSTTDRNEATYEPSRHTSVTQTPAGVPKSITAAVSLSYTYLAEIIRLGDPEVESPTRAQIEEAFGTEKERVVTAVAKLMIPPKPEQVSVVWHYDAVEPEEVVEPTTLDTSLDLAQKYGATSGLAVLALFALVLMMRLANRRDGGESFGMEIGLPKEAIEAARQAAKDLESASSSDSGSEGGSPEGPIGRADAARGGGMPIPIPVGEGTDGVLEAAEVEEAAVRTQRMIDQVSEMTKQDAAGVANLVDNWIEQAR